MTTISREQAVSRIARYVSFGIARNTLDRSERMTGKPVAVKILPGWGEGGLTVTYHGGGQFEVSEPVPDASRTEGWQTLDDRLRMVADSLKAVREANEGGTPGLGDAPLSLKETIAGLRDELTQFELALLARQAEVWGV